MKYFIQALVLVLLLSTCKKEQDPFLMSKQHIGFLTDSTQVKDLESVFINDSVSKYIGGDEFTGNINDIEIYEKGGNLLMVLTPSEALDSTSVIKSVRVIDERFKTSKGITFKSTFKDIRDAYEISSIQNSLSNLIVSFNAINVYVNIDKKELPEELRHNPDIKIDAIQIPDNAKIKNFYIQWY
ncbi:MAG: hypothetical protein KJO77_11665 [Bacteroidia bacterium]|nr:hypothetical protein [Bacteroidia bacterium]